MEDWRFPRGGVFRGCSHSITFGLLLFINHGLDKIRHFGNLEYSFPDPFHIGHRWSLVLVVFAEVFCSLLLVLALWQ